MNEKDVIDWFNTRDYSKGIEILKAAGTSDFTISLLQKYNNNFTRDKMQSCMIDLRDKITQAQNNTHIPHPEKQADFFSLPKVLQEMDIEKAQLFRSTLQLRKVLKDQYKTQLRKVIKSPNRVTVKEACQIMAQVDRHKRPVPFSISVVTANVNTGAAGELIHWEHCTLSNINKTGTKTYATNSISTVSKNPNHWFNSTRNVKPLGGFDYRKIHIWLIFEINGAEVIMGEAG